MKRISPEEAAAKMEEGYVYLDVRSVPEFETGHPKGAYNIPLMHAGRSGMTPNAAFMEEVVKTFPQGREDHRGLQERRPIGECRGLDGDGGIQGPARTARRLRRQRPRTRLEADSPPPVDHRRTGPRASGPEVVSPTFFGRGPEPTGPAVTLAASPIFTEGDVMSENRAEVAAPAPPRLLDRVRNAIRSRGYSPRTEKAYIFWIRRFIVFSGRRHPDTMAEPEISRFLEAIAMRLRVSASTQNQAFSAVLFLYRTVLGRELTGLQGTPRAKVPQRVPVVLSQHEIAAILHGMDGPPALAAALLYACGLRLMEVLELRVKDIDFDLKEIVVRKGKGQKDRRTMLPPDLERPLLEHLIDVERLYKFDLRAGRISVGLPNGLQRKYPNAEKELAWQWVFPAARTYLDPHTGRRHRHHLHETVLQRAFKSALRRSGVTKNAQLPQPATLLRHPPAGARVRPADHPGASRSLRHLDHNDLHARAQPRRPGCGKSNSGPSLPRPVEVHREEQAPV